MFSFQQRCPLCQQPIVRGQPVCVHPKTGAEVHAGCFAFEFPRAAASASSKKQGRDNG